MDVEAELNHWADLPEAILPVFDQVQRLLYRIRAIGLERWYDEVTDYRCLLRDYWDLVDSLEYDAKLLRKFVEKATEEYEKEGAA